MPSSIHLIMARAFAGQFNADTQTRMDSGKVTAFARQFEFIEQEITRTEFAPLKSEQFIPYDNAVPAAAESVTYRMATQVGQADFVDHYADDLPHADVFTEEFTHKVESLGVEYFWDVMEMERAAMDPSFRLDAERKESAIEAMRRKHDAVAAVGSAKHGRTGFLNCSAVPMVTPITGNWANATPLQIIADFSKLWTSIITTSKEVIAPTHALLPPALYQLINTKPFSDNTEITVKKWLLDNIDGLQGIDQWDRLATANAAGTGPRIVAYKRAKDVVKYVVPELFREEPPQRKNLKFKIPCWGRTGFTHVRKPIGIAYMDGC